MDPGGNGVKSTAVDNKIVFLMQGMPLELILLTTFDCL
jgi:hypothetical protein